MKITDDRLEVQHVPELQDGSKVEPEEQAARRVIETPAFVKVGTGPKDPYATHVRKNLAGSFTFETSAGEAAKHEASYCIMCKHFRNDAFRALKSHWEAVNDPSGKVILDKTRSFLGVGPDVIERELATLGLCEPLTEACNEPVIVFPEGGCPDEGPNGEPFVPLFKPRDAEMRRHSAAAFDRVMSAAQGRNRT